MIGKPIFVNGVPFTVAGAPRFYGIESAGTTTDLWLPLQNSASLNSWGMPATPQNTLYASPDWYNLMLMARLKPGLTANQAIARATPLFAHAVYETVGAEDKAKPIKVGLFATPARGLGTAAKDYKQPLRILMGMVAVVLLIASVNIVMLLVARNTTRERDLPCALRGSKRTRHFYNHRRSLSRLSSTCRLDRRAALAAPLRISRYATMEFWAQSPIPVPLA